MVTKCELIFRGTSPVDKICFIGPFKPYLAENIPFKALIAIFWELQPLWPSLLTKPDLGVLPAFSLQKEVGDPQIFHIFDIANSSTFTGKIFRKKSMLGKFRANVLNWPSVRDCSRMIDMTCVILSRQNDFIL